MTTSFNKVFLLGRLVKDPESKELKNNNSLSTFRIAVDRGYNSDKTDFFQISAFGRQSEFASKYLHKGDLVMVEGRVHIDDVEQQDGTKKSYTSIIGDNIQSLPNGSSKKQNIYNPR